MENYLNYAPEDFLMEESFQRYCRGEEGADIAFWDSWIQAYPEKTAVIQEAKHLFAILQGHKGNLEEETKKFKALFAANNISPAMREDKDVDAGAAGQLYIDNKGRLRRRILRIAGIAAAFLLVVSGIRFLHKPVASTTVALVTTPVVYTTYSSEFGTRKKITLTDGSTVTLNSNSSIQVPDDFDQRDRQVLLNGAAFFNVVHNDQKPFTVHARNLATVDIGTSFFVRAYDYEGDIKVLLLTGKVKVETNSTSGNASTHNIVELNPGEKLMLNKINGQLQTGSFDMTSLESWKTGRLNFKNASFSEVISELQTWYGVEFNVAGNEQKNRHFTGQFDNENLGSVLKVISFSMNCHYKIEDNKVMIRFK